jgi:hypothetical protein
MTWVSVALVAAAAYAMAGPQILEQIKITKKQLPIKLL